MKINKFSKITCEKILYFCSLICIGAFFVIFYRRFLRYSWDIDYHRWFAELLFNTSLSDMQEIDSHIPVHAITYPLYHLTLKVVAFFLKGNYHWASYLVMAASNVISIVLFKVLILQVYKPEKTLNMVAVDILSISAILFVVVRSPLTEWRFYSVQCAPNPVHNPTLLFVRPIGILGFIAFVYVIKKYELREKYINELVVFALLTFVSVFQKPSYAVVYLPAMGIVTLMLMIKNRKINIGIHLLIAVLPSIIAMIWQIFYMDEAEDPIRLSVMVGGFTGLDFLHIVYASLASFPVVIVLFSYRDFKENVFYRVSVLALVIGWIQMFFLSNGPSGDFSWGYDLSIQFATVISLALAMNGAKNKVRTYIAYALFAVQVVSGIHYIALVFTKLDFLI